MKVILTTNGPAGLAATKLMNLPAGGCGWVDRFLEAMRENTELEMVVVSSGNVRNTLYLKSGNISYYILTGGHPVNQYDGYRRSNIEIWESILEKEKPDLLHIGGCESSMGASALSAAGGKIPATVYIQGVAVSLLRFFESGIDRENQRRIATLRDYMRHDTVWQQRHYYEKMAGNEKNILTGAGNAIVESEWCKAYCRNIAEGLKFFHFPIPLNKIFFSRTWGENYKKHAITCPLSYGPIKGLHNLLKAVAIVKKQYPDVTLRIPGKAKAPANFIDRLKQSGYNKYLLSLILENGLSNAVRFLGFLSAEEMADNMMQSNLFVMCSAIENHSTTLQEAMSLGLPCISSYVGGIPEYLKDEFNGLLYRYEEYEVLAKLICDCFESENLCRTLSKNAAESMRKWHSNDLMSRQITDIYTQVVNNHGKPHQ